MLVTKQPLQGSRLKNYAFLKNAQCGTLYSRKLGYDPLQCILQKFPRSVLRSAEWQILLLASELVWRQLTLHTNLVWSNVFNFLGNDALRCGHQRCDRRSIRKSGSDHLRRINDSS